MTPLDKEQYRLMLTKLAERHVKNWGGGHPHDISMLVDFGMQVLRLAIESEDTTVS